MRMEGSDVVKRITGKDVAARAGVTAATVSYVLSGSDKHSISKETRERVIAAAHALGYVPDKTAKSLRRRESKTIGVAIDKNLATPRYALALQGMTQAATRNGYRLLLCRTGEGENGVADYLNVFLERQVDGIIYVSADNAAPSEIDIAAVMQNQVPFVALDTQLDDAPFGMVDFDYCGGARLVTSLLLSRQSGRVVYIRPEFESRQEALREQGVTEACRAAGVDDPVVVTVSIGAATLASFDEDKGVTGYDEPVTDYIQLVGLPLLDILHDGDLVVCSWAGWSGIVRTISGKLLSLYADLANDLHSSFSADYFGVMPNYEAGEACVEQVIAQIGGAPPTSRLLPIRTEESRLLHIHENT